MIQYVTTKIVSAWPEARQDIPGYAVEYADGYRSWCPKDKFREVAIALGPISHLEPYQQRTIAELAQLIERMDTLERFLTTGNPAETIGLVESLLLIEQLEVMQEYAVVLRKRVKVFNAPKVTE